MEELRNLLSRLSLSGKEYEQAFLKAKQMKYNTLMELMIRFNGRPYESFYQFIDKKLKTMELILTAPKKWGDWYFDDPIKELRILPNGLGAIMVTEGEVNPGQWILNKEKFQKVMVRFIVERAHPQKPYGLLTPENLFELSHQGVVPLLVRIVAYTKERRYKLDVNLVKNEIIADFRWDKIPPRLFKRMKVHDYFLFDKVYASLPIPHFSKMIMEALFESNGLDMENLTLIFNVIPEILENNLGVLIKHNLVEYDKASGEYRIKFLTASP